MRGTSSLHDPFSLPPYGNMNRGMAFPLILPDIYNPRTKTQVNQSGLSGTIRHFVVIGTSTSSNSVNATYTPTNTGKCLNLSIGDGGIYLAQEPMFGCAWPTDGNAGCWGFDFADQMVSAGKADYCNVVPLGQPNGMAADWIVGGPLTPKLACAYQRLAARGWSADAVLVMTGENDTANSTSQSTMTANLDSIYTAIRNAGFTCPAILSTTSYRDSGTTSSAITSAQATAQSNGTFLAGPNTDLIGAAGRFDGTHFNATGRTACATAWKNSVISGLGL